eukprot:987685-Rhodomonas_salina.1
MKQNIQPFIENPKTGVQSDVKSTMSSRPRVPAGFEKSEYSACTDTELSSSARHNLPQHRAPKYIAPASNQTRRS